MKTAKVITESNGQTVHLPDKMRLDGDEVFVTKIGPSLILMPKQANRWESLAASLELFSDDFMENRNQPTEQRQTVIFP